MKYSHITVIALLSCIVIRLTFILYPFWGLEYEDSFIYNDTGRFLNHSYDYSSAPFKAQSCCDGSYQDCYNHGSFGGHFLTFPYFLSLINSLIGYHTTTIFWFNFSISILLLSLVIYWYRRNKAAPPFSLNVFLILFAITPFIPLFNTSGLAETLSSLFVLIFVLALYKCNENDFKLSPFHYGILLVSFCLAIITKRENYALLILLYLVPLFRLYYKKVMLTKPLLLLILLMTAVGLAFASYIELFHIESNESGDISTGTFSQMFLLENLAQLFYALINFSFWGITGIAFLFAFFSIAFVKKLSPLSLMSLTAVLIYILVYSSHYRSYYQVHNSITYPFETLRYSVNYFPLVALFVSSVMLHPRLQIRFNGRIGVIVKTSFLMVLIALFSNSLKTRKSMSEDEYFVRIEPVQHTLALTTTNDIIITDIAMVFHCYCNDRQHVIDVTSLIQKRLNELVRKGRIGNIYVLRPHDLSLQVERYGNIYDFQKYHLQLVNEFRSEQYQLLKISSNATKNERPTDQY